MADAPTFGSLFAGAGGFDLGFEAAGFRCAWQVEIDRTCRAVLARHWPDVPRFEDVRDCGRHNLAPVDVVVGGFPCFPAGTLILTRAGLVPIEVIRVGDEVYTHAGRWRPVTRTMTREAPATVTLGGGINFSLTTTPEHPVLSSAGRVKKHKPHAERGPGNWYDTAYSPPEWRPADETVGRYWATPVMGGDGQPPPVPDVRGRGNRPPIPSSATEAFMWVVGAWVGDGWVRRRKDRAGSLSAFVVCCPEAEARYLLGRLNAAGFRVTVTVERTVCKLVVSNRAVAEWLVAHFGEKCHGKRIPVWLLECAEPYRRAFLDGYVWADGEVRASGEWRVTSVCRPLVVGAALLGTSLGYACSTYHTAMPSTCVIEGRVCNQRDQFVVTGRPFRKQSSAFRLGGHVFSKCRKTAPGGPATVFNLAVADDESYVADGVVVHNCQGVSVAGRRRGLADGRTGLWWEMHRIVSELLPRWVVWENVPGLLTGYDDAADDEAAPEGEGPGGVFVPGAGGGTVGGRRWWAGAVVRSLSDVGYVGAWRVLDARFFGVPQRRRRVFGVFTRDPAGRAGADRCAQILAFGEGV